MTEHHYDAGRLNEQSWHVKKKKKAIMEKRRTRTEKKKVTSRRSDLHLIMTNISSLSQAATVKCVAENQHWSPVCFWF